MNSEKITEIMNKVPFTLLLFGYLASLGYDYYSFTNDPTSTLGVKKAELVTTKEANARLQTKVAALENFAKTLETKKIELRRMVEEFQQVSGAISDHLDTPLFMKMVITEAKRIGLKVESLKPKGSSEKDFYSETAFSFSFRGVFGQLLVFLQRLANTTEIVRIDDIELKPNSSAFSRFVEVKGDLEIRTFTYLTAKADALVKQMTANSEASSVAAGIKTPASVKAGRTPANPLSTPSVGAKP